MVTLEFNVERLDEARCTVSIRGAADIAAADLMKVRMEEVAKGPYTRVVLDLTQLSFLTSLALGEMLALNKAKKAAGGMVVIAGPNEYVHSVLKQARVAEVIKVYPTIAAAEEAIGGVGVR